MPNPTRNETPEEMRQRALVLRENARLLRAEAAKCFHAANQLERAATFASLAGLPALLISQPTT